MNNPSSDPRETAWRIHAALGEWTARVDAKASFALTLESAALAGIVALSDKNRLFANLTGFGVRGPLWAGILLILAAAVLAILVVVPRLRPREALKAEFDQNFIYFGHLQFWEPTALADRLQQQDMLPALSNQLVNMSKITWRKHRFVQLSFVLAGLGGTLVFIAGIAS
ncbi:Pycsar system effector family protein [Streptomyces sp. IBSNAI002]|uniref:Pycsar system effector family protein n=1 Tax=Streptomyces sp. IBSNAI002 TaxID=3457500 RepID=UPI003FCFC3AC